VGRVARHFTRVSCRHSDPHAGFSSSQESHGDHSDRGKRHDHPPIKRTSPKASKVEAAATAAALEGPPPSTAKDLERAGNALRLPHRRPKTVDLLVGAAGVVDELGPHREELVASALDVAGRIFFEAQRTGELWNSDVHLRQGTRINERNALGNRSDYCP
jgi:hypothetical protein